MFFSRMLKFSLMISLIFGVIQPIYAEVPALETPTPPFWRGNAKVWNKISEHRDIVVSVVAHKENAKKKLKKLSMQGIGIVNLSSTRSFESLKDINRLKNISDYIKNLQFNPKTMKAYMMSEAFDYRADMWLQIGYHETDLYKEIRFKVVQGAFKGLLGNISFKPYKTSKSQIMLRAEYEYSKLPFPQFFVEFGLEVVLQKIAAKVRTFLESQKKKKKVANNESN